MGARQQQQMPAAGATALMGPAAGIGGDPRRLLLGAGIVAPDGRRLHELRLREMTGADEELLFERHGGAAGAARVSLLLARLIEAPPGWPAAVDVAFADALQLGDRDLLLLRLRQLDLGDAVHQVARCPHCSGKVDVDFLISELPLRPPPPADADGLQTLVLADCRLRLRLPTGGDQQAVEALALDNPAAANTRLFGRLVADIDGRGAPSEDELRGWPLARRQALAGWLQAVMPGPDLALELACPHCGADMSYVFDLHAFFLPSA